MVVGVGDMDDRFLIKTRQDARELISEDAVEAKRRMSFCLMYSVNVCYYSKTEE